MHRPAALTGSALNPAQILQSVRSLRGNLPSRRNAWKIGGIATVVVALLAAIALFSPLAHPRDLQIEGVTGSRGDQIRAAIEASAGKQSTFMVSDAELMASVRQFPEVAAVEVDAHPPFRLDLNVVMRPPVARLQIGGNSFVLAGDGTVLQRAGNASVPRVDASITGVRIDGSSVVGGRGALKILGAAPEPLLDLARTIRAGRNGLEIVMQRGPRLIFGNANAAVSKWAAAAAVLADGAATRATYIDLRVPARPAVGGLGGSRVAGAEDAPPSLTAVSPETASSVAPVTGAPVAAATGTAPAAAGTGTTTETGTGASASSSTSSAPLTAGTSSDGATPEASGADPSASSDDTPTDPVTTAPDAPSAAPSSGGATLAGEPAP